MFRPPELPGNCCIGVGAKQELFRHVPLAPFFHLEEKHSQSPAAMRNGLPCPAQTAARFGIRDFADNGFFLFCPEVNGRGLYAQLSPLVLHG